MISAYATKPCPHCGKTGIISIDEDQLFKWLSGSLIQEAFPSLPSSLREQLMTGMHPECWEEVFAELKEN